MTNLRYLDKLIDEADDMTKFAASMRHITRYKQTHYSQLTILRVHAYQGVGEADFTKLAGVLLTYFDRAFGAEFTSAQRTAWTNFMKLFVAIVVDSAEGC